MFFFIKFLPFCLSDLIPKIKYESMDYVLSQDAQLCVCSEEMRKSQQDFLLSIQKQEYSDVNKEDIIYKLKSQIITYFKQSIFFVSI